MKKLFLLMLGLILFFQINSFASNGERSKYSIIEVVTPAKEVGIN